MARHTFNFSDEETAFLKAEVTRQKRDMTDIIREYVRHAMHDRIYNTKFGYETKIEVKPNSEVNKKEIEKVITDHLERATRPGGLLGSERINPGFFLEKSTDIPGINISKPHYYPIYSEESKVHRYEQGEGI